MRASRFLHTRLREPEVMQAYLLAEARPNNGIQRGGNTQSEEAIMRRFIYPVVSALALVCAIVVA